ncbi:thymidine kinase-like [Curcuma longa]|uniref:thymidine kinase-like n=1 Tax=Curcuma longa TaxID=136217 RepID=UPI003D9DBD20
MFAGKTTALLCWIQAEDCGRLAAMVKPERDMQYGRDSVVPHDGVKMPCFALSKSSALRDKLGDAAYHKAILCEWKVYRRSRN